MENKLNTQAIENYSTRLTKKLSDEFFAKNLTISGHQILSYTQIEQVNLFIISNLFEKWKEETAKLKSPFFDYESQDVKSAMKTFMNVLSKHIAIRRADFDPLMRKAVSQTLQLALAPYLFIKETYFSYEYPIIQIADFKDKIKYIRLNRAITDAFIKKIEKHNLSSTPLSYALDYLNEAYKDVAHETAEAEPIIKSFQSLENVTFEELVLKARTSLPEKPIEQPIFHHSEHKPETPIEDLKNIIKVEEIKAVQEEYKKENNNNVIASQSFILENTPEEPKPTPEIKEEPLVIETPKTTKPKVDIAKTININQRFMFVNGLFKGEAKVFQEAIEKISLCNNAKEALELLIENYSGKFNWNHEQEEVLEFFDFVTKKF